jgi:hypothetical protein
MRRHTGRQRHITALEAGSTAEIVELAILGASQKRCHLIPREDQSWSTRMTGVAHRNVTTLQRGSLHAVAELTAALALTPGHPGKVRSWHAVSR